MVIIVTSRLLSVLLYKLLEASQALVKMVCFSFHSTWTEALKLMATCKVFSNALEKIPESGSSFLQLDIHYLL